MRCRIKMRGGIWKKQYSMKCWNKVNYPWRQLQTIGKRKPNVESNYKVIFPPKFNYILQNQPKTSRKYSTGCSTPTAVFSRQCSFLLFVDSSDKSWPFWAALQFLRRYQKMSGFMDIIENEKFFRFFARKMVTSCSQRWTVLCVTKCARYVLE